MGDTFPSVWSSGQRLGHGYAFSAFSAKTGPVIRFHDRKAEWRRDKMGVSDGVMLSLVQMAPARSKQDNVNKALAAPREAAARGARLFACRSCFTASIRARAKTTPASPRPNRFPDRRARPWRQPPSGTASWWSVRCSSAARRGCITTRRWCSMRTDRCGIYRKMHIPDDPLYYEKFYFTPGDLGFRSFATRFGRIGVCVCWDQWYPEAARLTALTGAEMLFYPTAIGWLPDEKEEYGASQHSAWETMMRSHAIANGVFVAAPNRVGREGQLEFWGASFVCRSLRQRAGQGLARGRRDCCW